MLTPSLHPSFFDCSIAQLALQMSQQPTGNRIVSKLSLVSFQNNKNNKHKLIEVFFVWTPSGVGWCAQPVILKLQVQQTHARWRKIVLEFRERANERYILRMEFEKASIIHNLNTKMRI
jgi:hypothetical protein